MAVTKARAINSPLLIGIDLGTTNAKVACHDLSGRVIAEAKYGYPTHYSQPAWYEQNPRDWITVLTQGMRDVAGALGSRAADVVALGLSAHVTGLVPVDKQGDALAPSPTWQDKRSCPEGERLLEAVGSGWIGPSPPTAGFPAKLAWLMAHRPEIIEAAYCVTDNKGFLYHWLTGAWVTDPSCGPGGFEWWPPVFDYLGWPLDRLPAVALPQEAPAALRADLAGEVGLPGNIPVFVGVNDGAAAALGSGAVRASDSVTTLATNCAAFLVSPERLDTDLLLKRFMFSWPYVETFWINGGFTCSGASCLQWLADLIGMPRETAAYDVLLDEAARVPAGSRGATFVPYLAGRGTPYADYSARGGFAHVGIEHGRAELTRAVLEGVAYALKEVYDEFERLRLPVGPIRLTGGGARSHLWRQIIANILQQPVIHAGADATLGNAMIASVGLRLHSDFAAAAGAMVRPLAREEPQPEDVARYAELAQAHAETCNAVAAIPRPRPGV